MVEIKPFKGITYAEKDVSNLICPPYDVIDDVYRKVLQEKDKNNFVNIILKDKEEKDYKKQDKLLKQLLKEKTLEKSDKEKLYLILQVFQIGQKHFVRIGLSCLVKLESYEKGNILPHEHTFPKIKKDRLQLMHDTNANTGQIFFIYDDGDKKMESLLFRFIKDAPAKEAIDEEKDVGLKLIEISDEKTIDEIKSIMKDKQVIIADGHHRYETALEFADLHPDNHAAQYLMCYMVSNKDSGLMILPTNRIIFGLKDFSEEFFLNELSSHSFSVAEIKENFDEILAQQKQKKSFVVYLPKKNMFYIAAPVKEDDRLDVEILHEDVIDKILKIDKQQQMEKTNIEYVKGKVPTFEKMCDEMIDSNIGFFLNAPSIGDIFMTVSEGKLMPQKSTFFYPKIYSGLVFRLIE